MLASLLKKNILSIFIFFILFTESSSATLVSKGDYVEDTTTSLNWLKINKTKGKSYNQILQEIAAGGTLEGWRLARESEFMALLISLLGITPEEKMNGDVRYKYFKKLTDLLGTTLESTMGHPDPNIAIGSQSWSLTGLVESNDINDIRLMNISSYKSLGHEAEGFFQNSTGYYSADDTGNFGVFLVKTTPVSEPASLGLMGLGLIGFIIFSRRRPLS